MTADEQTVIREYENEQFRFAQLPGVQWVYIFPADPEH